MLVAVGATVALETAHQLAREKVTRQLPLTFLFNPDEEVGSVASRAHIEAEAVRNRYVLVTEPKRNGGKTPGQLVKHVAEDKLVLWGWEPGGQRAPVSVPHAQFVGAFKEWVAGGMPCPPR